MSDVEILGAIKDLAEGQKLTPCIKIGYNAGGDLVELRKVIVQSDGSTKEYKRLIDRPDVADIAVDKWITYGAWVEV